MNCLVKFNKKIQVAGWYPRMRFKEKAIRHPLSKRALVSLFLLEKAMGKIEDQFMKDLVSARDLVPKIQKYLNEPGDLPENLDHPSDEEGIDAVFGFGAALLHLTSQLQILAIKLCVGVAVREAYHYPEEEPEEETMDHEEKKREFCVKDSD